MRIVFFGTPEFAVPALDAILSAGHEVALVVAQPDRPAGRGMRLQAPPVITRAREHRLPVAQPEKIRDAGVLDQVARLAPDAGVVVAYGKILPTRLLDIPRLGFLNVHASLLPKYRGAAPIQRAIANGDAVSGVTIMKVDEELDHGPLFAARELEIAPDERAPEYASRLAQTGGDLLAHVLQEIENGTARAAEQDHGRATYAPKIEKDEGLVDWTWPAAVIYNRFRAFYPWPGTFTRFAGDMLKLLDLSVTAGDAPAAPGTVLEIGRDMFALAAGEGAVFVREVQQPGRQRVNAGAFARTAGLKIGTRLG